MFSVRISCRVCLTMWESSKNRYRLYIETFHNDSSFFATVKTDIKWMKTALTVDYDMTLALSQLSYLSTCFLWNSQVVPQTMKRRNPLDIWEQSRVPYRSHKELLSLACFRVVLLFSLVSRNSFLIPSNLDFWVEWVHATPLVFSISNDIIWFFFLDSRQKI